MNNKLFGTDGIRGVAGEFPLDFGSIQSLAEALTLLLKEKGMDPRILVGRDTRESGPWMEEALFSGMQESGGDPVSAGVIPTSAVSYLTKERGFSAGIVISASHNPFQDNGIKIFSPDGFKIPPEWEEQLETVIWSGRGQKRTGAGEVRVDPSLLKDYENFLKSQLTSRGRGAALKLVLDCSNGASSSIAPEVMKLLGFKVETIHDSPDGRNINTGCGSLHPESLARAVVEKGADIGIAYDGDADRALWVDETGRILNGDHTLYVQGKHMKRTDRLRTDKVVATKMSNMGLEKAFGRSGIELIRTQVGDKYVLEEMINVRSNLGGEQSGHTIFLDDCPTGDGILTSLKMLETMSVLGESLSSLVRDLEEYPQLLVNVPVSKKPDFQQFPEIMKTLESVQTRLGEEGRLDLRYSGTEPLARIMIEGKDVSLVEACAHDLAGVVRKWLGPHS